MFSAKFTGPYITAREVLPSLAEGGSITFFSGVLSRRPSAGATGLGAVNAAVEALSKGLALELAGRARVNCISPGMVATEAYDAMSEEARDAMYTTVGDSVPIGRVGQADEIAQAAIMAMTNFLDWRCAGRGWRVSCAGLRPGNEKSESAAPRFHRNVAASPQRHKDKGISVSGDTPRSRITEMGG